MDLPSARRRSLERAEQPRNAGLDRVYIRGAGDYDVWRAWRLVPPNVLNLYKVSTTVVANEKVSDVRRGKNERVLTDGRPAAGERRLVRLAHFLERRPTLVSSDNWIVREWCV